MAYEVFISHSSKDKTVADATCADDRDHHAPSAVMMARATSRPEYCC